MINSLANETKNIIATALVVKAIETGFNHRLYDSLLVGLSKMGTEKLFGEVLEATDKLSLEEQEELMDVLSRRIAERRRGLIAQDIRSARNEFQKGGCHPATPDDLMSEILS